MQSRVTFLGQCIGSVFLTVFMAHANLWYCLACSLGAAVPFDIGNIQQVYKTHFLPLRSVQHTMRHNLLRPFKLWRQLSSIKPLQTMKHR